MPQIPERAVRDLADSYVASIAGLDPSVAIALGMESGSQELADLSPAGYQARDDLDRATLAELNRLTSQPLDRSRLARVVIAPSERHRAADGTACADESPGRWVGTDVGGSGDELGDETAGPGDAS